MIGKMNTESKRRFVGWPLLVAFLITVAALVCSFFMHTRLAVAQMVERDYRPKNIEIAFSQVGWSDQMHFYVEYRVIMPNDGTFFESSVPRYLGSVVHSAFWNDWIHYRYLPTPTMTRTSYFSRIDFRSVL
jgi:hypothetical protein